LGYLGILDVWRASELDAESTSVGCPASTASFALIERLSIRRRAEASAFA